MAKIGCISSMLGILSTLLAVATRLSHWEPLGLGPRDFAAGAALMLLLSIAAHSCHGVCSGEEPKK
jgi:hypothetical protein